MTPENKTIGTLIDDRRLLNILYACNHNKIYTVECRTSMCFYVRILDTSMYVLASRSCAGKRNGLYENNME